MNVRDYGNGIIFYENGLSNSLCDSISSFYYANMELTKPGITISGKSVTPSGDRWKNTIDQEGRWHEHGVTQEEKDTRARIDEEIYNELRHSVSAYLDSFKYLSEAPGVTDTGYLWQMYIQNNGYYREHVDGQQWVYAVHRRICGIICYVNTVDQGGETYFKYQNLHIKPEKGGVVIFPAHWMYPHESLMPTSSDKLIISSFLECEPLFHVHEEH